MKKLFSLLHLFLIPSAPLRALVGKSSADSELTATLHVEGANPLTGQGLSR
jgi:hypothetical protein